MIQSETQCRLVSESFCCRVKYVFCFSILSYTDSLMTLENFQAKYLNSFCRLTQNWCRCCVKQRFNYATSHHYYTFLQKESGGGLMNRRNITCPLITPACQHVLSEFEQHCWAAAAPHNVGRIQRTGRNGLMRRGGKKEKLLYVALFSAYKEFSFVNAHFPYSQHYSSRGS